MKYKIKILLVLTLIFMISCTEDKFDPTDQIVDQAEASLTVEVSQLSSQQLAVQNFVKARPIIAHRGTTEYAPENTAASYRFARNVGADYIQVDLQMSADGYLIGFRNDLDNHTNLSQLFSGYENAGVNNFTLSELKSLDAGSYFSDLTFDRASYQNLKILTLEEIINICEGKLEDGSVDPADNGNRPGIYIRLYNPWFNPGLEENLKAELQRLGWYNDNLDNLKVIPTFTDKVAVANTKGRVFLATQEKMSLLKIEEVFQGKIPVAYWLWKNASHMNDDDAKTYAEFISYGIDHGAQFIAPNTSTSDLLTIWQSNLIRRTSARIQGYTISVKADLSKYTNNNQPVSEGNIYQLDYNLTDGLITNRPQYATYFFGANILPVSDRIIPAPMYLNTTGIKNVFINLGY